jgi:dTDP-4-dehydrorhamnose 3,5-epimerase-like enzyme
MPRRQRKGSEKIRPCKPDSKIREVIKDRIRVLHTELPEIKIVVPEHVGDSRGSFSEVWNARDFCSAGIDASFVQDNHVRSPARATLRGLHYQMPPPPKES